MSGTFPKLGAAIHETGFAVLIIDLRNHGESAVDPNYPNRYSFGVFERQDVLGAYDFLRQQGFDSGRIGVLGTSLGGATTVGAASEEPGIGLIVLDSTFADLNPIIEKKFEEESGLPMFFLPGVLFFNQLMYGYDFRDIIPADEIVGFAPKPVMIVHCINDEDVDMWHPERMAEVLPHAHSWYMEDCEHSEIYRDHPEQYENIVVGFMDENLK
jgi:pimeloyl-ACP methyl ester carboxylesterase